MAESWARMDQSRDHLEAAYPEYLDRLDEMSETARHCRYRHLRLQSGRHVLDAGCGLGEVTRALAQIVGPNGAAVGVDLNAEHLALAQERIHGGGAEYRQADLKSLPFDEDSFDAIYCERVFQHLTNLDAAMSELFRVLRPGGASWSPTLTI